MRRIQFFLLIFFSFCAAQASAQLKAGPKVGLNAGKINGKSFKEAFNYNYLVGVFTEVSIAEKWSFNPELLFLQTSSTTDTSFANATPSFRNKQVKAKLNYLSIPLMVSMRLGGPLHIEAGPQFGILMNKDKKLMENSKEAFKRGDFSIAAGVGAKFSAIRANLRYVIGVTNISESVDQDKWKNQAIQLSAGYAF